MQWENVSSSRLLEKEPISGNQKIKTLEITLKIHQKYLENYFQTLIQSQQQNM
jgi:hypothetical protein